MSVAGAAPAGAADPVDETASQACADVLAVRAATRTASADGYVMRWTSFELGQFDLTESFDPVHQTRLYATSRGDAWLNTPSTQFRSLTRDARTRAILTLAGRPAATWKASTIVGNPDYRPTLDYPPSPLTDTDPVPPDTSMTDVVDSATVATDPDGTRHWVVHWHRWSPQGSAPNPDMLLTADPQGRMTAWGEPGAIGSGTVSYDVPTVARPTRQQYISWQTFQSADAAYTLRSRVAAATLALVRASAGYARAHHRSVRVSDVRYEAPRVLAARPASLAPVRAKTVPLGMELYGWNAFTGTWVAYLVRVVSHRLVVTRAA
jgi:hypothetical protein